TVKTASGMREESMYHHPSQVGPVMQTIAAERISVRKGVIHRGLGLRSGYAGRLPVVSGRRWGASLRMSLMLVGATLLTGCGYNSGGLYRSNVKTVYVEMFQ